MIKLIENAREAFESTSNIISIKDKVFYINQLMNLGCYAIEIGKYEYNSEDGNIDKLIKQIQKSNSKIIVNIETEIDLDKILKYDTIDFLTIPFALLETINDTSLFKEKLIIIIPVNFNENSYKHTINCLEYCKKKDIKRIKIYNSSPIINKDFFGLCIRKYIYEYPEIEFILQLYLKKNEYKSIFDLMYNSGCRFFETSINGWSRNKIGCTIPTEKIITYFFQVRKKSNIHTLSLETAYNTAKKIFSES